MKKYLYIAWVTLFICLLVSSYFFFVYDSSENEFLTNTTEGGIFSFEIMALQNVESGELSLILTGNDGVEVFVHYKSILTEGFKTLIQDQRVSYEVTQAEKGLQAVNVTPVLY